MRVVARNALTPRCFPSVALFSFPSPAPRTGLLLFELLLAFCPFGVHGGLHHARPRRLAGCQWRHYADVAGANARRVYTTVWDSGLWKEEEWFFI